MAGVRPGRQHPPAGIPTTLPAREVPGAIAALGRDPLGLFEELSARGPVVRLPLGRAGWQLVSDPQLERFAGRVSDSGEGRWTLEAAIQQGVPAHVLSAALFERFASQGEADFQNRVLSAMRFGFGGHHEKPAK